MSLMEVLSRVFIFVIIYYAITKFAFKTKQAEKNTVIATVVYFFVTFILEKFVF